MTDEMDIIKAPIDKYLSEFEKRFKESMKSSVPLIDIITRYIYKRKGKQVRPMFVFLTAELCGGVTETTYTAATLIELLHTATLVHDDIVDDSNERRGFFSVNALWKNKIAVLVGDFLLSRGMLHAIDNNAIQLLQIVSNSVREMSEGELLQIQKARDLNIEENIYFDIIRKKTATLIASCCACGAASAGVEQSMIDKMYHFGELTGIAFQLKDDLFDYEKNSDTGKPHGIDIKEHKMTLPLIYMLRNMKYSERKRVINIIKNHSDDTVKVAEVIKRVNESGGIAYTRQKMLEYQQEAANMLLEFPDSEIRKSLERLVKYIVERKK
ncbi:MAG TPA: polyprenyl synthetase family protein [Bacteroidales bacterium]|nr:polyprenyl synthetase family protein [Bacteroidales bacterium]HPS15841.1 polyprenyl synthetase family protein [Bacteroidales bacterium]